MRNSHSGKFRHSDLPHCLAALSAILRHRSVRLAIFLCVEFWHGKTRNKRHNRSDTQLGRLLDYQIHLFAFGETERESDLQRRFPLGLVGPKDFQFAAFSGRVANHRIMFPTGVVEDGHLSPGQTQHPTQMCELRSVDGRVAREYFFAARKNAP